jgi:hypothetical protein
VSSKEGFWKFHDLHKGETGLIIANGPGLANVPTEFMRRYVTLGCNRITNMTPDFVPDYYFCLGINQLDTEEKRATIYPTLEYCKAAFINRLMIQYFPYDNVYSIMGGAVYHLENPRFFSYDPLFITGLGATMVFVMLQVAFYMGFDPVLIVGLDHKYPKGTAKHYYDDSEFPQFEQAPGPVYNDDNDVWQPIATQVLQMAQDAYAKHGRTIINLSSPTACPVFRKEALSDWLAKDR